MSISAGMYEVTSRPTSCSRTAGFDQTFMTSSYFGKMPSKIGWPRRGPTHWSDDLFLGSLQSADPEHASPDRHGGYKPQAPHERKSKGLTNACPIRHLIGARRRPYHRLRERNTRHQSGPANGQRRADNAASFRCRYKGGFGPRAEWQISGAKAKSHPGGRRRPGAFVVLLFSRGPVPRTAGSGRKPISRPCYPGRRRALRRIP